MITPIIINNFARVTSTKNLVDVLWSLGHTVIHVIDNYSGYPPLYEWYYSDNRIKVHHCPNLGPRAGYDVGLIRELGEMGYERVVYTDSDIEIPSSVPGDFMDYFNFIFDKYPEYGKVGAALQIDDLPDYLPYRHVVERAEKSYHVEQVEPDVFVCPTDTTFALVPTNRPFDYKSLRIGGKYTMRHLPWYENPKALNEEEKWVIEHSNSGSTHASQMKPHIP